MVWFLYQLFWTSLNTALGFCEQKRQLQAIWNTCGASPPGLNIEPH